MAEAQLSDQAKREQLQHSSSYFRKSRLEGKHLDWLCYVTFATTFGLLVLLFVMLTIFGALIRHYEIPEEIELNRIFQGLIERLNATGVVAEEDLVLIAEFSRRDIVKGVEGFSTFDEKTNDWTGDTAESFFGAVSYSFDLASTIGYGSFTAVTNEGRAVSIIAIALLFPVAVVTYTRFIDFLYNFVGTKLIKSSSRYQAVINRYDAENLGQMDKKELFLIFQDLGLQVTNEQCEIILEQYDTNNDNHLDEAEFRQLCLDLKIKVGYLARSTFAIEFATAALVLYILFFTVIAHLALEINFFESFYFVMITITTVGLGDVVPPQKLRAPFSVLAFFGIGLTALLFKTIVDRLYEKTNLRKRYFLRALQPVFDSRKERVESIELAEKLIDEEEESNKAIEEDNHHTVSVEKKADIEQNI